MKHNNILYILLLIVLIFLIIYKNKILEGLTYIPNMIKINESSNLKASSNNKTYAQCESYCKMNECSGFMSTVPKNSRTTIKGKCKTYYMNDPELNINNLKNLKYKVGSYLYIN
jgi:hypothetical protein